MTRPLPLIAGLLGVLFLAIAAVYWLVPAGSLPSFFPEFTGFVANSAYIHVKRAVVSLIIAIILFAFAWFLSRQEDL